jgi:uncharacterized protein
MYKIIFFVAALIFLGASCEKQTQSNDKDAAYTDGTILIAGREISFELAEDGDSQTLGLSGRSGIEENQSMLFTFAVPNFPIFWMKDMLFPIDMVWIKGDEIVDITKDAQPEPGVRDDKLKTYKSKKPADKVLELKSGWADRNALKIGDKIEITRHILQP